MTEQRAIVDRPPATMPAPAETAGPAQSPDIRNIALTLLAVGAVILLLRFMQSILIPFVLAVLMFYALDPLVDRLQRARVPRAIGAAVVLLLLVSGVAGIGYALREQAMTVIDDLPEGARRLSQTLQRRPTGEPSAIEKVQQAADELQKDTGAAPRPAPGVMRVQVESERFRATSLVWTGSLGFLSALSQGVMILFLTYFMLLSDVLYKRKLVEIVGPTLARKRVTVEILSEIASQMEQFMLTQIFTSTVVALVTWIALWLLGLEQAPLWGVLAGVFNSIPYYGPLMVSGGLAVVAFLQFGTLSMTATVAGVSLLITTMEGFLLTPRLMGRVAQMNTVAVFAGLLFWNWAWGIWGMLLAVPMMMVLKVTCDRVERFEPIGRLLGE